MTDSNVYRLIMYIDNYTEDLKGGKFNSTLAREGIKTPLLFLASILTRNTSQNPVRNNGYSTVLWKNLAASCDAVALKTYSSSYRFQPGTSGNKKWWPKNSLKVISKNASYLLRFPETDCQIKVFRFKKRKKFEKSAILLFKELHSNDL